MMLPQHYIFVGGEVGGGGGGRWGGGGLGGASRASARSLPLGLTAELFQEFHVPHDVVTDLDKERIKKEISTLMVEAENIEIE